MLRKSAQFYFFGDRRGREVWLDNGEGLKAISKDVTGPKETRKVRDHMVMSFVVEKDQLFGGG